MPERDRDALRHFDFKRIYRHHAHASYCVARLFILVRGDEITSVAACEHCSRHLLMIIAHSSLPCRCRTNKTSRSTREISTMRKPASNALQWIHILSSGALSDSRVVGHVSRHGGVLSRCSQFNKATRYAVAINCWRLRRSSSSRRSSLLVSHIDFVY